MTPLRREILLQAFKLLDLLVMVCSFILAAFTVYSDIDVGSFSEFLIMRIEVRNFILFLGLLLLWQYIFSLFRLYYSRRLSTPWGGEVIDIVKATTLGALAIWVIGSVFKIEIITPLFLSTFWTINTSITIFGRLVLRYSLKRIRLLGRNLLRTLIVGTNSRAVETARKLESKLELGYRIIGFVDEHWSGNEEFQRMGYSIVTDFSGFRTFLKDHVVDEVIICAPVKSFYEQSSCILAQCEEQGITVRFAPDVFTPTMGRPRFEYFDDDVTVTIDTGAVRGGAVLVKHLLDFSISLVMLIVLASLFLIIALLIKSSSPGPVFFIQDRIGLNKRGFRLYKFRTMIPDAETKLVELEHLNEVGGPVFKIKNDPRITLIGKFLRKTSLDELPQLINVLKGDMSLVGPRPLPVRDYKGFGQDWHRRRFSVQPGITCLWQIQGRNSIPFEKWMELDMQYIDNWSLWLDFKILLKTVPVVLKGSGAY